MLQYIGKRILLSIPTLVLISLAAFIISTNAPGDPITQRFNISEAGINRFSNTNQKIRAEKRHELGLDLPVFYFSFNTLADYNTPYLIENEDQKNMVCRLSRNTGNPIAVEKYYTLLKRAAENYSELIHTQTSSQELKTSTQLLNWSNELQFLLTSGDTADAWLHIIRMDAEAHTIAAPFIKNYTDSIKTAYTSILKNKHTWKKYIPVLQWHGFNNQYHHWIKGILLNADFGVSYQDQQAVIKKIGDKFLWSFVLSFISVVLSYLISIPIGVYSAWHKGGGFDNLTKITVFVLYSIPNFFLGTMLLVLFANPEFLNWFPSAGVQNPVSFQTDWSFFTKLSHWMPYLVLPLITYLYSSFAFLSRQMHAAMDAVLNEDYITTARAKGLSKSKIIWKHAFRNALLPIITIFSQVFPLAIGGSIIVETIFSIPGMGLEIYNAVLSYDYPMIVAIFTIFGILTLFGYLLADILYVLADPRISFTKR